MRPRHHLSSLAVGPAGARRKRSRVLLLAPSAGLGGGIERYLGTIEDCLRAGGADVHRVNLREPGTDFTWAARLRFVLRALATARRLRRVDTVVVGHPNLIPVGALATKFASARRAPVLFYGIDIWQMPRTYGTVLTRHSVLRPMTISSYSAGALSRLGLAAVLRPGISASWRARLLAEGSRQRPQTPVPMVLSVFRLSGGDWEGKGLRVLLDTLASVRQALGPVRLVLAGQGPASDVLLDVVSAHDYVEVHESPDDNTLARLYAAADLFVLCTRTRPPQSGEGYGIVLLEAQLAGCAVVGPVSGGSHDAYLDGVTGARPADESAEALTAVLLDLLRDRAELARIGRRAAEWAEATTRPEDYLRSVFIALTGGPPPPKAKRIQVPKPRPALTSDDEIEGLAVPV